ncbi:hypothetical protein EB796_015273 [Bugula neritina]|uniref:Uncharacterized protein n=1 Tax=Bugula neritina TaxID=10212 RepID=A0A7J7JM08_BUGNE|nr:hypothetical protein EB796_015273 [Bugula neritina]
MSGYSNSTKHKSKKAKKKSVSTPKSERDAGQSTLQHRSYVVDTSGPPYRVETVTPETSSGDSPAEYATETPPHYDVACSGPAVPIRLNRYSSAEPYYQTSIEQPGHPPHQRQILSPLKQTNPALSPMRFQALQQQHLQHQQHQYQQHLYAQQQQQQQVSV